ncbi:hypothetical protein CO174_00220 [Candidatus Uhrbacteria bacterium CG_4_9_14_3_um_filter_50_9]|uniref:Clp R domain-containing protein n=1 Tax=Candidatus Uhrbacteria bacterium CG_4_9_14_3_um_filter_50_9 TaxID=1975035 RepID=A0A2M7XEZ5_9BACT|nr:MAG: hypothetical protein CO174_00220 [Candidatus Uhrbacteria bacterium CG_4_9_14_3_um_filter_50_9]
MALLGLTIKEQTYAWLEPLDEYSVTQHAAKNKSIQIVGGFLFSVLIIGLITSLALFLFTDPTDILNPRVLFETSWRVWFLYLTLLAGCVLFAHQQQLGERRATMPVLEQGEEIPAVTSLTGEAQNLADVFSDEARAALERGFKLATTFGHASVSPLHLFIGALESNDASIVFGRLGLTFEKIKDPVARYLQGRQLGKPTVLSEETERVLLTAFLESVKQGLQEVPSYELFVASFDVEEFLQELFLDSGVSAQQFHNMIEWIRINDRMRIRYQAFKKAAAFKPTGPMNRSMTSVATPILDQFSEDLTTAGVYGQLPILVGREREIEEVFRVIEGGRQSAVLVGSEGVGKQTILAGIAQLMVEERVPKILEDKRLVRLSVPHLISGVDPSMAQERMMRLFYEVSKSRNIILAVTDLEQMTGLSSGNDATADLAATFVDFLSRGGTFAIATATPRAYVGSIERSVLGRVFQKVDINEPDETSAIHMLQSKIGEIEYNQKVVFSYEAVEKAVQLSDRYMHEEYLPKKAITIAREAALMVSKLRGEDALVLGEDVAQIVTEKTGVKATSVASEEKDTLLNLEERMHGRVIGQDEAVKAVASALRRARAELSSQDRPLATFLFLGPTGVGKTELAKTVAQTYFGNEDAMIRLDMSEYQSQDSIHRLIGVPGSNQGGLLTEAVRKQPFAIVLLDELEKAHPEILNIFLQVFDDGRLTDAAGRTIDFKNTIIVSTSNAGTQYIQDAVGRGEDLDSVKTHLIEEELKGTYRPEFLNRFDGVIVFKPLTQDEVFQIAGLMIGQVAKRLEPKGIFFRAEPDAVKELSVKGYDPKFGARPLRRVVQEEVDNAIANALLAGKVKRRDTIVLKASGTIEIEKGKEL